MIRHLLKLVWNRKRGNLLVTLEIFVCFLVLFATVVMIGYYANNYRQPVGYDYEDVWSISTSISLYIYLRDTRSCLSTELCRIVTF